MTKGQRFSQLYIEKGDKLADSSRFRNRLGSIYQDLLSNYPKDIVRTIHNETGAKVPFVTTRYSIPSFFDVCECRDLLDSITLIYQLLTNKGASEPAKRWYDFVERALREENLGYRLDEYGVVHFFIDQEFEQSRTSTVEGLAEFPAARSAANKAYAFLDADPIDTTNAVRSMFEALEVVYKHITDSTGKDRLNAHGVRSKIMPIVQADLRAKEIEVTATNHLLEGLCDWIDAGHMYRHGQKTQEPEPPSLEFTVLYLSQGASYVRYLAALA